jgi:hypothetical protein
MIKTIRTTIVLGEGEFADGTNTRIIEGLATTVDIEKAGLPDKNTAKVKIANLNLAEMEQLTFLAFRPLQSRKNKIMIEAGEKGKELSVVFKGDITSSFPDFSTAPDIFLNIEAMASSFSLQMNTSPTSIDGEISAPVLFEQFANEAGFGFINNGISATVKNSTFVGSPPQKAEQLAKEINCELIIDDENYIVQKWDEAQGVAVVVSPESGLIGYPSFTNDGISCKSFFNPALKFGGQIRLESMLPRATGFWKITKLAHSLSAYTTGEWTSSIDGVWLKEEEGKEDPEIEVE